jgi:ABC-2 type transport system permease protein
VNPLINSLWAESLKIRKSKIFLITIGLFSFVAVMLGLLVLVARHPEFSGRSATIGAKASIVGNADWPSFCNLLIQMVLSLGVLGYGIVASWVFGREYADRVIKDLLALPIARHTIVVSKFVAVAMWCIVLTVVLWAVGFAIGWAVHIPKWSTVDAFNSFKTFLLSSTLTILLCTPVAFFASLSRGYLLPIGFVLLSLIMTNLIAVGAPGLAPYFPWAFPALLSGIIGQDIPHPNAWSFILFIITVILGYVGTVVWWRCADQT